MPTDVIETHTPTTSKPARRRDHAPSAVLVDRRGLAAMMSVGVSTGDKLRAAGLIGPAVIRVGGSVRWHRAEVEAWLAHRAPNGELYDATTWPAIWERLKASKK